MPKNYSRMYDDVMWLKKDITAELRFQAAEEYDLLPKDQTFPDMRMIKALTAACELQDYLAGEIALDAEENGDVKDSLVKNLHNLYFEIHYMFEPTGTGEYGGCYCAVVDLFAPRFTFKIYFHYCGPDEISVKAIEQCTLREIQDELREAKGITCL